MDLTPTNHDTSSPIRGDPELNDPNGHIKAEQQKRPLITMSDTSLRPHTMMIELVDTLATCAAM